MGSGNLLLMLADILSGPLVSLVYPLYATIQAIESKSVDQYRPLLIYWIFFSMINLVELTFAKIIAWLPFWCFLKLIANCWLVLPYFNGSVHTYENFIKPIISDPTSISISSNIWMKDLLQDIYNILIGAGNFIKMNGPRASERVINRGVREVRHRNRSYSYTYSNDDEY